MDRVGAVTVHIKVATIINWRCVQLVDGNGTRSVKLLITRETKAAERFSFHVVWFLCGNLITNFFSGKKSPTTEGEVFEFKCSTGLLFDITRQICDFKAKVDNCDINSGETPHTRAHARICSLIYKATV